MVAARSLQELEDRGARGEYISPLRPLAIYVGQGDVPAMRRMLLKAWAEVTPVGSLILSGGPFLEAFRNDPKIGRLLFEWYGP